MTIIEDRLRAMGSGGGLHQLYVPLSDALTAVEQARREERERLRVLDPAEAIHALLAANRAAEADVTRSPLRGAPSHTGAVLLATLKRVGIVLALEGGES